MRIVRIDRVDDPRIEEYRSVADAELLRRRRLFVAEGRLVVGRLLEAGHEIRSLLLNEASSRALGPSLQALTDETPVYVCSTDQFQHITGFNLHRGCLALAARPAERSAEALAQTSKRLLILEGVADADNVGSAFRNAAAFGVDGVLLSPTCCDPLYRKAVRTSMGFTLRLAYARVRSWPADLGLLKAKQFTLIALTPRASAVELAKCGLDGGVDRLALLVGTEGSGVSDASEAFADLRVRISMAPGVDSLNLAAATGIALHHFAVIP